MIARMLARLHTRAALDAPLVVVKWHDTHAQDGAWLTVDEISEQARPRLIVSVGYRLPEVLSDHLTIAQDHDPHTDRYAGIGHIPNAFLVSVLDL